MSLKRLSGITVGTAPLVVLAWVGLVALSPAAVEPRKMRSPSQIELADFEVDTTGVTTIGAASEISDWIIDGIGLLNVEVCVTSNGLNAFRVELKDHSDGEWYTYLSGTDFDTATSNLPFVTSEGPHEIEAAECAHFHMNARNAYAIRFGATAVTDPGFITIRASGGRP